MNMVGIHIMVFNEIWYLVLNQKAHVLSSLVFFRHQPYNNFLVSCNLR